VLDQDLVLLDLETTGATAAHDRITEIGLVEIRGGRRAEEWSTLVNPGTGIPPRIQQLTGITDDMVALAPAFAELADMLLEKLRGRILVAHNARFDYGFLRNEFRRAGLRYASPVLCTVRLSRKLYPAHPRHNLDTLLERHQVSCATRHRALGDAAVLWELLQCWRREHGAEALAQAATALLKHPTLPSGLPDNAFDDIPESAGTYTFYDERDVVLYVGKSINLRSRVMDHFSGDHRVSKDARIAHQVKRIGWAETAGELGALLQEARLVKETTPVFNRRLRRTTELWAWHWQAEDTEGVPRLVGARDIDPERFGELYGMFRSRSTAVEALREIATAHGLCLSLTGLEQRTGPCFAYQLKRCRGACAGRESRLQHGLRLTQALAGLRMRPWPYPGRIGVREYDAASGRSDLHVLDRWCHLGTVQSESELQELAETRQQPVFELDTYRILARFLEKLPRNCTIVRLARADAVTAY